MLNVLKGFLAGFLAGCLFLLLLAYNRHIVRTPEGHMMVAKESAGFHDIYVDVREWGPLDYIRNRPLTDAMARQGYEAAKKSLETRVDEMLNAAEGKLDEAKKRIDGFLKR